TKNDLSAKAGIVLWTALELHRNARESRERVLPAHSSRSGKQDCLLCLPSPRQLLNARNRGHIAAIGFPGNQRRRDNFFPAGFPWVSRPVRPAAQPCPPRVVG